MKSLFYNARIVPGTGAVWDGYLAVDGNRIAKVGRGEPDGLAGFERVDCAGHTLLPGFIDCHVHLRSDGVADPRAQVLGDTDALSALRSARNAQRTVEAGITTIRDCGSKNFVDIAVRRAMEAGLCIGPRMVLSGMFICMTGGHGWNVGREADGPDGVRKAARENLRAGADNIKMIATGGILTEGTELGAPQLSVEDMRAGVEEAHKAGLIAAAHAHGARGVKNAVLAGVDSIEHGYLLDTEAIELMLARGTYLVATSAAVRNVAARSVKDGLLPSVHRKASEALDHHIRNFTAAHEAGVKLAMGTDSGVPFTNPGNNLDELVHLVAMGLSPMDAIVVSTAASAKLLRMDERIGTLEEGKLGDFVVFDGNPLDDISLLRDKRRMKWVVKNGQVVIRRDQGGHVVERWQPPAPDVA